VRIESSSHTVEVGRRIGSLLTAGDLIILDGPLGSGKTTLTRGIGGGMGVRGPVTSPTFVIARVHQPGGEGLTPLVHVDAYRVDSVDDLESLDLDGSTEDSATVVEWGVGRVESLTSSYLTITLRRDDVEAAHEDVDTEVDPEEIRTLSWSVVGDGWDQRLAALTTLLGPQQG